MSKLKQRLKEPSTWAGFAGLLQAASFFFPAHAVALNGLTAVAGCVAANLPERGGAAVDAAKGVQNEQFTQ